MAMPIHSHPSVDGSTGSAGSRESSPADSPAYLYPQENIQTNTQEHIQYSPEMTSSSVRQMSVLRHHDVIYSNSSHSHLPLRKRPYINAVANNKEQIQQPIRRRSSSPTFQKRSPTQSSSPYSKPLSPVRVPVIVSNPYSNPYDVWRHHYNVIVNMIFLHNSLKSFFHFRIISLNSSLQAISTLVLVLRMRISHHDSYICQITHVYDSWQHLTFIRLSI